MTFNPDFDSTKDLPEWDLSTLYKSPLDPKVAEDIATCESEAIKFTRQYQGVFAGQEIPVLLLEKAIKEYEYLTERMTKLGSYAGLLYYKNLKDQSILQFYQTITEKFTGIEAQILFFPLDISKIENTTFEQLLDASSTLRFYQPWFRKVRLFLPHQLTPEIEKIILEKSLTSQQAWVRLYDETLANLTFKFDNKTLTITQITDLTSHADNKVRSGAAKSLEIGLNNQLPLFTFIINTLIKDKQIGDNLRKYPTPASERHLNNDVEEKAIEALVIAVKSQYSQLSHRYYALKAKLLGVDKLNYWDRNAPLPHFKDNFIPWAVAQETVLNSYNNFSPLMAQIGRKFFDNNWVDAPIRDGKASGAFAHPTVPSANPFLLVNYQGKSRDVMTLAHELGHGIHQVLAAENGLLLSSTPLTLAETASVFGEMLTFQHLLLQTKDPLQKQQLLMGKIDDMVNTVIRQVAFYEFEKQIHEMRRVGELSATEISNIWLETQKEALGPAVIVDDTIRPYWCYISHFIHSPFYVYAYAFGDCLVNSLYAVYQKTPEGFAEKYIELLRAVGTKNYIQALKPFGLDANTPEFWHQGLGMINNLINQLDSVS